MSCYWHAQSDVPYIVWHNWPAGRRYWAAWLDDLLIYLASLVGRSDTWNTKENRLYKINIISDTADYTNIFSKFITEYLFFKHINININIISNVADYTNIFSKFITEYLFFKHINMNINIISNVADHTNINTNRIFIF